LSLICGYLEKAASKYKLIHGKVPVIFIDAADVIAKKDEELFRDLVHFAKVNANDENLIVVFVSSDATILPIVQSMPACANRSTFFSVGDLTDEGAIQYLKQNGLSEDSSRALVDYVGGHIVDLSRCLFTNCNNPTDIKKKVALKLEADRSTRYLVMCTYASEVLEFYEKAGDNDTGCSDGVITAEVADVLVRNNILRRNIRRTLFWHSRLVYNEVGEYRDELIAKRESMNK